MSKQKRRRRSGSQSRRRGNCPYGSDTGNLLRTGTNVLLGTAMLGVAAGAVAKAF